MVIKKKLILLITKRDLWNIESSTFIFLNVDKIFIGVWIQKNWDAICVYNKIVNVKQMTTVIHVDDMKVSHHDHQKWRFLLDAKKI